MRIAQVPPYCTFLAASCLAITVSACGGGSSGSNNDGGAPTGGSNNPGVVAGTISENTEIPSELRDTSNGAFYVSANTSTLLPLQPPVSRLTSIYSGVHERSLPLLDASSDGFIRVAQAYAPAFFNNNILLVVENISSETRCDISLQVTQTGVEESTGNTITSTDDAWIHGYYGVDESSRFSGSGDCISAGEKIYATLREDFDIDTFSEVRIDAASSESGELTTAALTVTDFRIGPLTTPDGSNPIGDDAGLDENLSLSITNGSIEPIYFNHLSLVMIFLDSTGLPVWVETDSLSLDSNFTLQPGESITVVDDEHFIGSIAFVGDIASVRFVTGIPSRNGGPQL